MKGMATAKKNKLVKMLCVALTGNLLLTSTMFAGCSKKKDSGNETSAATDDSSETTTELSYETRKTDYAPGPSLKDYCSNIYSVRGPYLKDSVTYDKELISGSNTISDTAVSEKYLYLYNYHTRDLNVYQIKNISSMNFKFVTSVPIDGPVESKSVVLADDDHLTIYPTSDDSYVFFFVESTKEKDTVLSCFDNMHVCSDGQTILCSVKSKLHYDPATKSVTREPFSLDAAIDLEEYIYDREFITEDRIFVRVSERFGYQLPHIFEYDLDGHFIREIQDDPRTDLYFQAVYDYDGKLLVVNYAKSMTIEFWDKDGNYIAGSPLQEVGLRQIDVFTFDVGSILKYGDNDFILICSEAFDSEKSRTVTDLVYRIHIIP